MSRFPMKCIALWLTLCGLLTLCACEKEMPGRLDGLYTSDGGSAASSHAASFPQGESVAAPAFHSGSYEMTSSTAYEQYIYDGANAISHLKTSQTYTYDIALTVNDDRSMRAVYTFTRIQTGYENAESVTMDTNDPSGRDEDTACYYDLIGQSFTVKVAADNALSVSGIDQIHQNKPSTANLVSEQNMLEIAADLFYNMEENLTGSSSWQLTQSGITNTYQVSGADEAYLYVAIDGGELAVPAPFTSEGITYTYTDCQPLSGSLVMSRSDRMQQEQASYQENQGQLAYEGSTYRFTEAASSVCRISRKG